MLYDSVSHVAPPQTHLSSLRYRLRKSSERWNPVLVPWTSFPQFCSNHTSPFSAPWSPKRSTKSSIRPQGCSHPPTLWKSTCWPQYVLASYRPISKLPLMPKVLAAIRPPLTQQSIWKKNQWDFHSTHCTTTALLRVVNDLLMAVDAGSCASNHTLTTPSHNNQTVRLHHWEVPFQPFWYVSLA